jgi:hypothetical protein
LLAYRLLEPLAANFRLADPQNYFDIQVIEESAADGTKRFYNCSSFAFGASIRAAESGLMPPVMSADGSFTKFVPGSCGVRFR